MADEGIAGSSRFGTNRTGSVEEELFLKIYAKEVLASFARTTVTDGRVNTRSITHGKSAQFPILGKFSAGYAVPGHNLIQEGGGTNPTYLNQPSWSEKVISIDGLLQSSTMIHEIDEAMSHYEVRAAYSREMGEALAQKFDVQNLQVIVHGSEEAGALSTGNGDWSGGQTRVIEDSDFTSGTAANSMATIRTINERMDGDDVPKQGRHIAVEPRIYYLMLNEPTIVSADYNMQTKASGTGGFPSALMYMGMHIHPTNRIADVRALGSSSTWAATQHSQQLGTDYSSNRFDHVLGVAWQESNAIGIVKLKDWGLIAEHKAEYVGTFMMAGFSVGRGVLHESACYHVSSVAP